MSNCLSVEQLYADGIGFGNVSSGESFLDDVTNDGHTDSLFSGAQAQENLIGFLDTHDKLEKKNAADKIKMFKKISNKYGRSSKSIESWCDVQSQEVEEAAATDGAKTPEAGAKKKNFFLRMFEAIANFFKKIFGAISAKFKAWRDKMKAKKQKTPEEIAEADKKLKKPDGELKKFCTQVGYVLYSYKNDKFKKFSDDFKKCTDHTMDITKDVSRIVASNTNEKGIDGLDPAKYSGVLNTLLSMVSGMPGMEKTLPTLKSVNLRDRKAFTKALEEATKDMDFGKKEEEYIKYFTSFEKIEKDEITPVDIFGPQVSVSMIDKTISNIMQGTQKCIDDMALSNNIITEINSTIKTAFNADKVNTKTGEGKIVEIFSSILTITKLLSKMYSLMGRVNGKIMSLCEDSKKLYF